ncbi:hypothetical protein Smp_140240 [Schistosoma mansoni]|uniref:hypothetical protein n=1 Tax=Schistosoma mansoni TaxID=6183 RepID=UPI0001A638D8|nr:hypothetical protein Smp_140240 [Schistosoma mansoni]|eukprot:XP_018653563.1 hypothetical protein Smp_140240 [Schistosoma mansoni]
MTVDVDSLRYAELQRLAKMHGIKANKKASELKKKLKILLCIQEFGSTGTQNGETALSESVESKESSFKSTDKPKLPAGDQENKENDGITSTPKDDDEASCVLNRTYEVSSFYTFYSISAAIFSFESRKLSVAKKPSVVKTIPDFSKIHAKAASKLESLVSYASRHNLTSKPRPPFASPPFVNNNKKVSDSSDHKSEISQANIPERKFSLQKKKSIPLNDKTTILKNSNSVKRSKSVFSRFSSNEISTTVNNQQQANNLSASSPLSRKTTIKIPADSAFARRKAYDLKCNQSRRLSCTPHRISKQLSITPPKLTTVIRQDIRIPKPFVNVRRNKMELSNICKQDRLISRRLLVDKNRGL